MADLLSKIGDLLYWEAKRDPELWRAGRPNTSALARRMETVSQTTVWRLLHGVRSLRREEASRKRVPDYMPEADVIEGLGKLLRTQNHERIWSAIFNAPPRPPEAQPRPRRLERRRATRCRSN